MEIKVTHMMNDDMGMLSGSVAELGEKAAKITWKNSLQYGKDYPLITTPEEIEAARGHFKAYGAWSREEIAAWDLEQLNAITCQDVAAAIREMEHYDTYEEFEAASIEGHASGRLFRGEDGEFYFYLGEYYLGE